MAKDENVSRCLMCGVYVYSRELCERCYPKGAAA
jgi:uncharacterized OB-fold protein